MAFSPNGKQGAWRRTTFAPLLIGVLGLGILLSVTVIPGVFTIDDNNYLVTVLALRQGRVTIANTEGLPPSRELLFFDPTSKSRVVNSTPVASTAPPLYAFLALPFSFLGWRGLVALNTLAYLATIVMVYHYTRRYSTQSSTPWLAAGAFAFGGYSIEYALGLWPQALSFALCAAGIVAASGIVDNRRSVALVPAGAASGFLLALAAGVRYQNAIVLAAVAAAIVLLSGSRRWKAGAAYLLCAAVPLSVSAVVNHARFDSWNPISKGPGYLSLPVPAGATAFLDPLVMFWSWVVDYSAHPELADPSVRGWLQYDPQTGAHMIFGAIAKKALVQSAPWIVLAFLMFVAAWLPAMRFDRGRRQQLRLLSFVAVAIITTFALAGPDRHDGLSFNARYLLELLPLGAVAFAWALDGRLATKAAPLEIGAILGGGLVAIVLFSTPLVGGPSVPLWTVRQFAILKTPLLLAVLLGTLWLMDVFGKGRPALLLATVGACLGWGLILHLGTDVGMSQFMRARSLTRTRVLAEVLPDRSALLAYWGNSNPAGPLLLGRDVIVLDVAADEGSDAPALVKHLLAQNRRAFVIDDGMTPALFRRISQHAQVVPTGSALPIVELRRHSE
jgi:hypothetical protein